MCEEAQGTTRQDLRGYLNKLKTISPPELAYIGSCTTGSAFDHRLNNGLPRGPFASESALNDFLIAPIMRCPRKELVAYYREQRVDGRKKLVEIEVEGR
jgi:hypothetical protein